MFHIFPLLKVLHYLIDLEFSGTLTGWDFCCIAVDGINCILVAFLITSAIIKIDIGRFLTFHHIASPFSGRAREINHLIGTRYLFGIVFFVYTSGYFTVGIKNQFFGCPFYSKCMFFTLGIFQCKIFGGRAVLVKLFTYIIV